MGWDYSDLSRLAKQNGGPAELLAKHAAFHFKKGAASKNPEIAGASLAGLGIGIGGTAIYFTWKKKKSKAVVTDSEIQKIEDELITGMEQAELEESIIETDQEEVNTIQPHQEDNDNENLGFSV